MAAVLACSGGNPETPEPGAALSHRSAAALWGLLPAQSGIIDVSIQSDAGRAKRRGIRLHRCSSLASASVTHRHAIPVTKPARTIADLRRAASARGSSVPVSPGELRRAIRQAEVLGLPLDAEAPSDRTRSELERLFLLLCRRHRLPMPEVNAWLDSMEVDFLWPDHKLVVETDGYRYHRGKMAFEVDRRRDLRLRASGYQVIRLSCGQVSDEPRYVAEVLRLALGWA
jgi:very-short-patch-repair endonuclease